MKVWGKLNDSRVFNHPHATGEYISRISEKGLDKTIIFKEFTRLFQESPVIAGCTRSFVNESTSDEDEFVLRFSETVIDSNVKYNSSFFMRNDTSDRIILYYDRYGVDTKEYERVDYIVHSITGIMKPATEHENMCYTGRREFLFEDMRHVCQDVLYSRILFTIQQRLGRAGCEIASIPKGWYISRENNQSRCQNSWTEKNNVNGVTYMVTVRANQMGRDILITYERKVQDDKNKESPSEAMKTPKFSRVTYASSSFRYELDEDTDDGESSDTIDSCSSDESCLTDEASCEPASKKQKL